MKRKNIRKSRTGDFALRKRTGIGKKASAVVLAAVLCAGLLFGSGLADVSADSGVRVTAASDEQVSVQADTYSFSGSGTEEDPYQISSLDDLEGLRSDVSSSVKEYHAGEYFILTKDLTLNSDWTAIGSSTSSYCFQGTLDGDGHTITYPEDYTTTATCVGLFYYIGTSSNRATVKNLTVDGTITASSATYIGGIAARGYCSFENCVSDVDITVTKAASTSSYYTGGLIGFESSSSTTMTGCMNTGTITSSHKYTGGLAGYYAGSVTDCLNTGTIANTSTSSSAAIYTGGISGSSSSTTYFISCANEGTLSMATSYASSRLSSISCYVTSTDYVYGCYTTFDVASYISTNEKTFNNYDGDGVTYVSTFALSDVWQLNTQGGNTDNSLFWGLDTTTYMAVFASDTYPAAVRVLYQLSGGTKEAVYTTVGSAAAAPSGASSDATFGSFVPNETVVTEDITVVQVEEITLTFYYDTDGTSVYKTVTATLGQAFEPPEDPEMEYCSFAGWVDGDGNLVAEGDILATDTLYATWTPTYDSDSNVYMLANTDALVWFAEQVNAGNTSINAKLVNDIDASSIEWTPIGTSSNQYTGTFDGGSHAVRLSVTDTSTAYTGFFSYLGSGGTVKDLTVKGSITGKTGVAGIAAYNYGTIDGCVNMADITTTSATYYAGGITAYHNGTIRNCGNEGDISIAYTSTTGSSQAGGIAGHISSSEDNDRYIVNCYNWGNITTSTQATTSSYCASAGGIVGDVQSSSTAGYNNYIRNCYSTGTLTASATYSYVGGTIARIVTSNTTAITTYITDCYYLSGTASALYNCSNTSYDKASVSNTYTAVFTGADYADLLDYLNAAADEEEAWDAWVADVAYAGKPAFRVSTVASYTVTYTGAYEGTESVSEGGTITLSYTDDVHHYYTFKLNTADGEDFDASTKVYGDLTLYVIKNTYQYTVTYDIGTGDAGSSVPDAVSYDSGSTVTVDFDTIPQKDGYTFSGWMDDDGNVYTEDGTNIFTILKDTTLTAQYTAFDFEGSGTQSDPYIIDSVETLQAMAGLITKGDEAYMDGVYYEQTANISLEGVEWSPAGVMGSVLQNGSIYLTDSEYDGGGYKITDLSYEGSDSLAAVFAGLNNSTVKDLTVEGEIASSGRYAGGLVGYLYEGSVIENCTVNMDVSTTASSSYAGGIAAYSTDASVIRGCTYEGTVSASTYAGGVVAYVTGGTTIDDVTAVADVTASNTSTCYAGGIAAYFAGSSSASADIINCGHQGTVTASATGTSVTGTCAGGLVANMGTSSSYVNIINSYHGTGAIAGSGYYSGGILGRAYSSHITISNCYSASTSVTSGYTATYLPGGVIGGIYSSYTPTITSSYYNADGAAQAVGYYSSSSNATDTSGISTITSASALAVILNTWVEENNTDEEDYLTWFVDEDQNGGYPVFGTDEGDTTTYMVIYNANGGSGTAPSDETEYAAGASATVLSGSGLSRPYYTFLGWATDSEATEAEYSAGDTITMTANITLFAVWEAYTNWGGSGTQDDPYTISTAAGMEELSYKTSASGTGTSSFKDVYFELTANIDLSSSTDFDSIGYYDAYNAYIAFNGTFDGNDYIVTLNLTADFGGVFGYTGTSAVIENLTVAGTIEAEQSTNSDVGYASCTGGIAGYNQGTITGCTSAVTITGDDASRAGGIAGRNTGTIDNCVFTGSVNVAAYAGGITGSDSGTIRNCAVKSGASVTASGGTYTASAGGIAGTTGGTVYNNYSRADVTGYYVGGIAGSTSSAYVRNNYSTGTLSGSYYTGGVIGYVSSGSVQNNYWLSTTADEDAGYDYNDKAFRNGSFDTSGNLTSSVVVVSIDEDSSATKTVTTLMAGLTAWVSYAGSDYNSWQETSDYPVFASDTDVIYTVSYTGDTEDLEETVVTVSYGGSVTLPTLTADGYTYTFTVDGETVSGTIGNITSNLTIVVTKTANTYTATFADEDGNTVATVTFTVEDTALTEPDVPEKDGYAGIWSDYEITAADLTITASYRLIGDVDGNGTVQTKDAVLIERYLAGAYTPDALGLLTADTDGDGEITADDAERIRQYISGIITAL